MSQSHPFDYNSTRPHLLLTEYGRNVQNMIQYITKLPTKEERNTYAQAVIELMGFLNPHLRDVTDFKHKLWDHLFIISDFKLDVDSPYPIPSPDTLIVKPLKVPYPANRIKFKHYGKTVEVMIEKAKTFEDPEKRALYTASIANFMKMSYVTFNKDSVADETIINDLKILSKGELDINSNLNLNRVDVRPPARANTGNGNNPRSGGGNAKRPQKGGENRKRNNNNQNNQNNNQPGGKRY